MRKQIPKSVRKQVYQKYNGHCAYCGCEIPDRLKRDVCTYNIALRYGMMQENREPIKFYFEKVGEENGN